MIEAVLCATRDHGTLFLDEIAELPEESQVALLRVLQEGEVRPLGASRPIRVDVRVVAATHQDLEARMAKGSFRQDLYARLSGYNLVLPPLRARRDDLGLLVGSLLRRLATPEEKVSIQRQAARALLAYPYPLNIRELEQALRTALALARGEQLRIDNCPKRSGTLHHSLSRRLEEQAFKERLSELLRLHQGNVTATGRSLGTAPVQIRRRRCKRYGIDLALFR